MEKWECTVCGWIYDPAKGDPSQGISARTSFEDLPEDWLPDLQLGKSQRILARKSDRGEGRAEGKEQRSLRWHG